MRLVRNEFDFEVGLGNEDHVPCKVEYEGYEDDPCGVVEVWMTIVNPSYFGDEERMRVDVFDSLEAEEQQKVFDAVLQDVAENRIDFAERDIDRAVGK